jgi:myo-inositol-1(or 4)-monophosphatase
MKLLRLAKISVLKASKLLNFFYEEPGVITNIHKDIKTIADLELNRVIVGILSYSNIEILSEELPENNLNHKQLFWVIDPLDGTLNFTRKFNIYGISVALWNENYPILGVIYNYHEKHLFYSYFNKGAFLNDTRIHVSNTNIISNSILATGFPSGGDYSSDSINIFLKQVQNFKKIRALGSASIMLTYVAQGIFDVYFEKNIYLWDVAAGLSLVKEAGGEIYYIRVEGTNKYNVLASNKLLFNRLKKIFFV